MTAVPAAQGAMLLLHLPDSLAAYGLFGACTAS